jgi:hypothetical protein
MNTETVDTTTATATTPVTPKVPQTATITLLGNGATMQIVAERKADESARTYVITTDTATKKSVRGMTTPHVNMEAAKKATEKLAAQASKLGWVRREGRRGFVAKADAFSTLPTAPKAKK